MENKEEPSRSERTCVKCGHKKENHNYGKFACFVPMHNNTGMCSCGKFEPQRSGTTITAVEDVTDEFIENAVNGKEPQSLAEKDDSSIHLEDKESEEDSAKNFTLNNSGSDKSLSDKIYDKELCLGDDISKIFAKDVKEAVKKLKDSIMESLPVPSLSKPFIIRKIDKLFRDD